MKTTGKYSNKLYKCMNCGFEEMKGTNHWGETYGPCRNCQWKRPMEAGSRWECLEPMPEGYEKPEPWKTVRLGDICKIEIV